MFRSAQSTSGLGRHSFKVVDVKHLEGSNPFCATKSNRLFKFDCIKYYYFNR